MVVTGSFRLLSLNARDLCVKFWHCRKIYSCVEKSESYSYRKPDECEKLCRKRKAQFTMYLHADESQSEPVKRVMKSNVEQAKGTNEMLRKFWSAEGTRGRKRLSMKEIKCEFLQQPNRCREKEV